MINFFVTAAGSFGIRDYLRARGAALADRVAVIHYEDLAGVTHVARGGTIFAALDQIGEAATEVSAQMHDQLAAAQPTLPILNDPRRALRRYDLLRRLHDEGVNYFAAIRATDNPATLRYPVFIRSEREHSGSLTPVLHDRRALDCALGQLALRGMRISDLLVVEYVDASDGDGVFRKYSAMRIGDAIVPRHLHASRSWITKSEDSLVDEPIVRAELTYLEDNPHERWLAKVFELAHIEYGRIDYGVFRGVPQAWEINMNPTLGRGSNRASRVDGDLQRTLREPGRALCHQRMLEAFKKLDASPQRDAIPIVIDGTRRRRLAAEARAGRRAAAAARWVQSVSAHPVAKAVKVALRPAVARIAPTVARFARR